MSTKIGRAVMVALGYVSATATQQRAEAQGVGGLLDKAGALKKVQAALTGK